MDSSRGTARIYPSLVRPVHVAGIERAAAGLLFMVSVMLLFAYRLNWISVAVVVVLVLVVLPALRRATKRDARVLAVFRQHVLRSGLYLGLPSHLHPHRRQARTL